MSDLIDRQAAIDAATKFRVNPGGEIFEAIRRAVRSELELVPSAQQWIPCSERMPSEDGNYLVSGKWTDSKFGVHEVVGECEYSVEDGYFDAMWNFDVLAWMPLPLPYQAERREE